jgi:hypothetical protein
MIESSHCFWKCDEIQDEDFWVMVCPDFGWVLYAYLCPPLGGMNLWVVMAACHCYL